jgi:hypothetical protein
MWPPASFPSGLAGTALLVLRLGLAALLIAEAVPGLTRGHALAVLLVICGVCIAVGWLTSAAAAIVTVLVVGDIPSEWQSLCIATSESCCHPRTLQAAVAASLALSGPGTASLDAARFGRREITLPPRATPTDSDHHN